MSASDVGLEHSRLVQDRLQQFFMDAGRGTKARVERELGLYDGFFDNRRGRGDLGLGVMIATLLYLKLDVGGFINEALGRTESPDMEQPKVTSPIAKAIAETWESANEEGS